MLCQPDELILSGCRKPPFEPVLNGCGNVVKPRKWHLELTSTTCVNTQGGMVSHRDRIFVSGIFSGTLTFTLFDVDGNVLNETKGPQSAFYGEYLLYIYP